MATINPAAARSESPWTWQSERQVPLAVACPTAARTVTRRSLGSPRGEVHTMSNAGPSPARMIEVISPAGFEHFFWGVSEAAAGPPDSPR